MDAKELPKIISETVRAMYDNVVQQHGFRLADEYRQDLVRSIRNQTFRHAPLSPAYKKWKEKNELDPRILIATKEYMRSIRTRQDGRSKNTWIVDLPNTFHSKSKSTRLKTIALTHEYGSRKRNIPPRPHWLPTYVAYRYRAPMIATEVEQLLVKAVETMLQQRMGK